MVRTPQCKARGSAPPPPLAGCTPFPLPQFPHLSLDPAGLLLGFKAHRGSAQHHLTQGSCPPPLPLCGGFSGPSLRTNMGKPRPKDGRQPAGICRRVRNRRSRDWEPSLVAPAVTAGHSTRLCAPCSNPRRLASWPPWEPRLSVRLPTWHLPPTVAPRGHEGPLGQDQRLGCKPPVSPRVALTLTCWAALANGCPQPPGLFPVIKQWS